MSETVERETISAFSMRLAENLRDAADDAGEPMDWFNIPNPSPEILAPIIKKAVEKYVFGAPTEVEAEVMRKALCRIASLAGGPPPDRYDGPYSRGVWMAAVSIGASIAEAALKAAIAIRKGNEG